MASLNMNGPYDLTEAVVDKEVTRTSPGNYALGHVDQDNTFRVEYVGRSDTDVKLRLKQWAAKGVYRSYKYSYATSKKDAFLKECKNYHDFDNLDNEYHPDKPDETNWKCPLCGK